MVLIHDVDSIGFLNLPNSRVKIYLVLFSNVVGSPNLALFIERLSILTASAEA